MLGVSECPTRSKKWAIIFIPYPPNFMEVILSVILYPNWISAIFPIPRVFRLDMKGQVYLPFAGYICFPAYSPSLQLG